MNRLTIVVLGALLVAGCSMNPPITPIGNGEYMAAGQNLTIFGSEGGKVAELMQEANAFCAKQGKSAEMLDSSGSGPEPGTGCFAGQTCLSGIHPATGASATVRFRCTSNN